MVNNDRVMRIACPGKTGESVRLPWVVKAPDAVNTAEYIKSGLNGPLLSILIGVGGAATAGNPVRSAAIKIKVLITRPPLISIK